MILHKLDGRSKDGYTTFGCLWKDGEIGKEDSFVLSSADGAEAPMQSRVTAYYPDGSVKWSAHTADASSLGDVIEVRKGKAKGGGSLRVTKTKDSYAIDAGKLVIKGGKSLPAEISLGGIVQAKNLHPVLLLSHPDGKGNLLKETYEASIDSVEFQAEGPLEAVVCFRGSHQGMCPFVIRMYVDWNSASVKFEHTFLYNGDEKKDYLSGLGIAFTSPLHQKELYNRHIKVQLEHGTLHEASAELLSWRPKTPEAVSRRQADGLALELQGEDKVVADKILKDMPFWDTYELLQESAFHFSVRKKIADEDCCFLTSAEGGRTNGVVAVNGMLLAIRDFWQKAPRGISVKGLSGDELGISLWLYAPSAEPFDFRHYANRGYNQVYYEGYDYKGATPYGIANTNEVDISFSNDFLPSDQDIEEYADRIDKPCVFFSSPEYYHSLRAFGYWSLRKEDTAMERLLERQIDKAVEFYRTEVEQRSWYGFFNYGDFMHTYDRFRHVWRYDMGGYAWDNTELVPTLWLWLAFLRSGDEKIFTLAEKLSRHASEVDVYHLGKFKGLGSRHNVRHWGCPCKEARIAMAGHHRYYYYLTGDRRLEDIFDELKDNEKTFFTHDPLGDFYDKSKMVCVAHARSGPDWSSLCSNWMTQYERTLDKKYLEKIDTGLKDIIASPLQLVSGPDYEFDPATCHLRYIGERDTGGTHLQICMGAPQIWMELSLFDPRWVPLISDYGRFYFLSYDEQRKEGKGLLGTREFSLPFMACGMGAYAAGERKDKELAKKVWLVLLHALFASNDLDGFKASFLPETAGRKELAEIDWISTNFTSQWCLNAIMCLEFISDSLPETEEGMVGLLKTLDETGFHKA
jgi:hypothetical protein